VRRLLLTLIACVGPVISGLAAAGDINYIAAIVNDSIITFQDVREASRKSIGALQQIYFRDPALLEQKANSVMSEALDALVAKALIVDEFKNSVGVVPENMLDNQISQKIRGEFIDRENFRRSLRAQGMSYEKYRQFVHDDMVVRFMLDRNVRSAIIISPQKIETYYTNHLDNYKLDNQVKMRMIVLTEKSAPTEAGVKKLAMDVTAKLDSGAAFAEMASVYSEGSQKRQGGDWGWVSNKEGLRKGLADVAFSLKPGERSGLLGFVSGPGEGYSIYHYDKEGRLLNAVHYSDKEAKLDEKDFTKDPSAAAGMAEPKDYYIMLVEDKRTAHVKSLGEVKDEIEKNLAVEERQRLHKQWIDRLKAKAFVRYPS
jgi:parvulin-like peptidyl-prolyl isomerase